MQCLWIILINWELHYSRSETLRSSLRILCTAGISSSILTLLSMNFKDNLHSLMHILMTSRATPDTVCQSRHCTQNQENPLPTPSVLLSLGHDKQSNASYRFFLHPGAARPACLPPQHWRWSRYGIRLGCRSVPSLRWWPRCIRSLLWCIQRDFRRLSVFHNHFI